MIEQARPPRATPHDAVRVLFITKDYPPCRGGMARYSYDLLRNVSRSTRMSLLQHRGSKKAIPLFAVAALVVATARARRFDCFHISCGMLSPMGYLLRRLTHKPVSVTVHGLDITRTNRLYRSLVLPALRRLDHVVCVSANTAALCEQVGVPRDRISVIPNGIDFDRVYREVMPPDEWRAAYGISPGEKVLLTIGNLTRRKGQEWFIREVLPKLEGRPFRYFVIGDGKDRASVEQAVRASGLQDRVHLLGAADERVRDSFYAHSDVYVMPNIPVPGDVEGFGIVAIEAGAWGLPVLTSGIEGIADAITPGITAVVYDGAGDAASKLARLLDGEVMTAACDELPQRIRERFDWGVIADTYRALFERLAARR